MVVKDALYVAGISLTLITTAATAGKWAADKVYVTHEALKQQRMIDLDAQITFIEIKISQEEASNSEIIYLEVLKQKARELQADE